MLTKRESHNRRDPCAKRNVNTDEIIIRLTNEILTALLNHGLIRTWLYAATGLIILPSIFCQD